MNIWNRFFNKAWPLILLFLVGFAFWDAYRASVHFQKKSEKLETTITDMGQEVKQSKINLNDSIELYQAEINALHFTKKNLEAKYNELLKAMKLKPKDVSSVTQVGSQVVSVDTVIAKVDTFGGLKAQLKDSFVRIDVNVNPDRKTIIDYTIKDSLSIINVQKKHKLFFGLIRWTSSESIRVVNHNPKARVQSLQVVDVIE